ncbi:MAG TPA: glycosyltransferase family 4 protein [Longimicrobiales bacterium]|nr:glycosyltransferase family 4 protein [Longimicrobiales bacterium]
MKLAIVASHPVQYQVPWYRALAERPEVDLTVYYALLPTPAQQGVGFGVEFAWDVPLLDGYRWKALPNVARSPSLGRFFGSRTPAVGTILERDRPGAVIVAGWHALPLLQAIRACGRLGLPCLVRGESSGLRPRPAWVRAVHRRLLSRFDAFLAIGEANRRFYRSHGVPGERVFTAPYFADGSRFREQDARLRPRREEIRRQWGIAEEDVCFLFAGKLVAKKRPLDLLRACDLARREEASIRALVAGAGEMERETKRLAARLELPATFTGFLNQSEISRAYVAADCLVLPSDYGETWGLVVNEAMHHGLPAAVSDRVGCGPDLVEDGITGRVFPCADVEALARVLVETARDREGRGAMGRRARRRVARYSAERAVEGTLEAAAFVTRSLQGVEA